MPLASASFETSTLTKVASPPSARTRSTVSWPAASPYSATTTLAPSAANIRAATRPIPPPAPVMIVTLSASRIPQPVPLSSWRPRPRVADRQRTGTVPSSYLHHRPERRVATMTADELLDAIDAGDAGLVRSILAADPDLAATRGPDGVSAVLRARYRFDRAVTDAILAADPDLDVFDAAALGYVDRLWERLDEDGGRATAYSSDGYTALHLAAFFGKPEAARILLEAGASVSAVTRNDLANQPLHAAAAGRPIEVSRELVAAGADVNATQHGGYTPLHEAAQHGDVELVELLLSAGADPSIALPDGTTPAHLAKAAGHVDLAVRLGGG